jgi:hypothetical protein
LNFLYEFLNNHFDWHNSWNLNSFLDDLFDYLFDNLNIVDGLANNDWLFNISWYFNNLLIHKHFVFSVYLRNCNLNYLLGIFLNFNHLSLSSINRDWFLNNLNCVHQFLWIFNNFDWFFNNLFDLNWDFYN